MSSVANGGDGADEARATGGGGESGDIAAGGGGAAEGGNTRGAGNSGETGNSGEGGEAWESGGSDGARRLRRLRTELKESMRELSVQLSLLNAQVSTRLELRESDVNCLDVISRRGPISPSALARQTGLHPATMTGILDRLERGGWISRERDPSDRRAVLVRAVRNRGAEIFRLYRGMNSAVDEICARYSDAELELLADFLRRTVDAGQTATTELAAG